jgi:uncharacterized tellurite resistance protein B-like protein
MSILEIFDGRDKKERLSHMRNLIVLSLSDNTPSREEFEIITKVGARIGLEEADLKRILERPESIEFIAPKNDDERIEQLYDMVAVMMVDGKIDSREVNYCKSIAIKLGFMPEVIDDMVAELMDLIVEGIAVEIVKSKIKALL